jgi:hypothetical protein
MIDTFSLLLSHGLLLLVAWRLLSRPDLDDDAAPPAAARRAFVRGRGDGKPGA